MLLAAHQCDLFPWTGFWYKAAKADLFDVAIWDQINWRGYTHRVQMAGSWATLPIQGKSSRTRICDVRLDQRAADELCRIVKGRYQGAPYWSERGPMVLRWIDESRSTLLWQFNLALLLHVREYLGVRAPLAIAGQPQGEGPTEKVLWLCEQYHAEVYLSGPGGRGYLGDRPEQVFARRGVELWWSRHSSWTGDSILTTLFDKGDPLAWVEAEDDREVIEQRREQDRHQQALAFGLP